MGTFYTGVVFPIRVIGDHEKNPGIERTLTGLGWIPHREHGNWTYIKSIKGFADPIKFELHTPIPPPDGVSVKVRGRRVKPKPKPLSGEKTVHGTPNPEAIGFDSLQADFIPTEGWAHLFLSQPQQWREDNFTQIMNVLSEWFTA